MCCFCHRIADKQGELQGSTDVGTQLTLAINRIHITFEPFTKLDQRNCLCIPTQLLFCSEMLLPPIHVKVLSVL